LKSFAKEFKTKNQPLEKSDTKFDFSDLVGNSQSDTNSPRNSHEDQLIDEYVDQVEEEPLTLKGDIPNKHSIKGYEPTNKIRKGILN
jgi:hypothetical protein